MFLALLLFYCLSFLVLENQQLGWLDIDMKKMMATYPVCIARGYYFGIPCSMDQLKYFHFHPLFLQMGYNILDAFVKLSASHF